MNDLDSIFGFEEPKRKKMRTQNSVIIVPDCDNSCELVTLTEQLAAIYRSKAKLIELKFLGVNKMNWDATLVLHDMLINRPPGIKLKTDARSPIIGGGVLLWLLGDHRLIRPTAWLFIRSPRNHREKGHRPPWVEAKEWWQEEEETSVPDFREMDYRTILRLINHYLPVKLLAGKPLTPHILNEYCLLGDKPVEESAGNQLTGASIAKKSNPPEPKVDNQPKLKRQDT